MLKFLPEGIVIDELFLQWSLCVFITAVTDFITKMRFLFIQTTLNKLNYVVQDEALWQIEMGGLQGQEDREAKRALRLGLRGDSSHTGRTE